MTRQNEKYSPQVCPLISVDTYLLKAQSLFLKLSAVLNMKSSSLERNHAAAPDSNSL